MRERLIESWQGKVGQRCCDTGQPCAAVGTVNLRTQSPLAHLGA